MIRNQFSYWLTTRPADPKHPDARSQTDALLTALNQSELAGDLVFQYDLATCELTGEIPDGTIEENTDLVDHVRKIAARFPGFHFEFTEQDEDDKSNYSLTRFANGVEIFSGYRRTVDPGELDMPTIQFITDYLRDAGYPASADAVTQYVKSDEAKLKLQS